MDELTTLNGADELNRWLGRREAFGAVAGRCSAADVECMKRIRDGRLFLSCAKDWEEFCDKFLHISKSKANHLIALRERYGDAYFLIMQMTRISEADYRAIAPAVSEQGIECNGEFIPLRPENTERIATAVASLVAAATKSEQSSQDRLSALNAAGTKLLDQFRELGKCMGRDDPALVAAVAALHRQVERLTLEIR
jgi:hypothetical protein